MNLIFSALHSLEVHIDVDREAHHKEAVPNLVVAERVDPMLEEVAEVEGEVVVEVAPNLEAADSFGTGNSAPDHMDFVVVVDTAEAVEVEADIEAVEDIEVVVEADIGMVAGIEAEKEVVSAIVDLCHNYRRIFRLLLRELHIWGTEPFVA